MNAIDMVGNQVNDLLRRVSNSSLLHGCRIITETVYDSLEASRKICSGHGADALDLGYIGYRHDTCNNRNGNALLTYPVQIIV